MDPSQEILRVPQSYTLDWTVLNGATNNFAIQIQQKADFEWVNRIASPATAGKFRVSIQDGATGRNLITNSSSGTNQPNSVNNENYFGTAQLPNPLLQPYIFARSSTILVTIQNTSGGDLTGQLVFDGFDLYPAGAPGQGSSGALVPQGS